MLGMNDGGYKPFDAMGLARYKDGMEHILSRVGAALPGVRFTVLKPGAYDDVTRPVSFPGGYDDVSRRHGCVAEGLGRARGATIVDMRTALNDSLRKLRTEAPDLAPLLIPDRVHPSARRTPRHGGRPPASVEGARGRHGRGDRCGAPRRSAPPSGRR